MCWYWQPPQRPKYGHGAATRSAEGSTTRSSRPRMNFFFREDDSISNQLSREDQGDKYGMAVVMRQAVAAIHKFFDSNFHSGRFPMRGV